MSIYCICTQCLVGAPFALITASIRRGVEVISLCHCWGGMEAQVSLTVAFSSSAVLVSWFSFSSWQQPIDCLWGSGLVSLLASQGPRTHCKFQEWQPHLYAGVSPINYRSMCVQNSTHSRICYDNNICCLAGVNKSLAVRYVPFLTKGCFCPSILTKLPLIDVQCCVYAREAALESSVLQCCHVLIFTSAFKRVVWS